MKPMFLIRGFFVLSFLCLTIACQDSKFEKTPDIPAGEVYADGGVTPPRTTGTTDTSTTACQTENPTCPNNTQSNTDNGTQITYGGIDDTCTWERELLGSLKFKTNNEKHLELFWNNFVAQPGVEPAAYYRVIVYGTKEMTPETTWISQKLQNGYIMLRPENIGSNSPAFPQYPSANTRLDQRVVFKAEEAYWYDIVAFKQNGQVLMTRHLDVRQTAYNQTFRVAGFCTF